MIPKVSVIMPCYNEPEDIFRRSLESVTEQTLTDIEIILILDNPENTLLADIIKGYMQKCNTILFLQPEKNLGRGRARNLGVQRSSGKYIAMHDADDVDYPERLKEQYEYMEAHPELSALCSQVEHITASGEIAEKQPLPTDIDHPSVFRKRFNNPTFFLKSDVMRKHQGYKNMNYGEDFDLWIRLILAGEQVGSIDTIHTQYLAPEESFHSHHMKKMIAWRKASIQIALTYAWQLRGDPHFYRYFFRNILNYIMLHTGEKSYEKYTYVMKVIMDGLRAVKKRLR